MGQAGTNTGDGSDSELGRAGGHAAVKQAQLQVSDVGEPVTPRGAGLVGPPQDGRGGHDGCTCRLAASSRMTCSG
jgi:hypothetical protein